MRHASVAVFAAVVGVGRASEANLRGGDTQDAAGNMSMSARFIVDPWTGTLSDTFVLHKRFDLAAAPSENFDIREFPDKDLTHSCSNYISDPSTVFTRDGNLVLKVSSVCDGGGCLNSGRVMSKESFKYGLFTFTARVPKCNYIWPALWLLPQDQNGEGTYGRWPCSGEIDVLETVHDQAFGTFNVVAGYGSTGGCYPDAQSECNECQPGYCTSTTMSADSHFDRYFVQETTCEAEHPTWDEHTFVLNWQPDELTTWVDPVVSYDAFGRLKSVHPKPMLPEANGMPTWRTYRRQSTPTWLAVEEYMNKCFAGRVQPDAPFDEGFKIVLNIAVGGYGGAPCQWGSQTCGTTCGGAVGSELVVSDISVWERPI